MKTKQSEHGRKVAEGMQRARARRAAILEAHEQGGERERLRQAGLSEVEIDLIQAARSAPSPIDAERDRLRNMGLGEDEIAALIRAKFPGGPLTSVDPVPEVRTLADEDARARNEATSRIEQVGADPAMIQAYEERMKTYVPPPGPVTLQVTMEKRWADYVAKRAVWEGLKRRRDVTPEEAVVLLIRAFWLNDEDRQAMSGGATGRADRFNPVMGNWNG